MRTVFVFRDGTFSMVSFDKKIDYLTFLLLYFFCPRNGLGSMSTTNSKTENARKVNLSELQSIASLFQEETLQVVLFLRLIRIILGDTGGTQCNIALPVVCSVCRCAQYCCCFFRVSIKFLSCKGVLTRDAWVCGERVFQSKHIG